MKINENENLKLDAEELKAWPFWNYGWHGADGTDWRSYATDKGLAGIPDMAEEATPLTPEQAEKWDLYLAFEHVRFLDDGAAEYAIRAHRPVTVGELAGTALSRYVNGGLLLTVGRSRKEYHAVDEIPGPLRGLVAVTAAMLLNGPDAPLRLHVDAWREDGK